MDSTIEEDENTQRSVPVIEEELVTGTREVKTGSVRVRKEVEHLQKAIEMPLVRDVVKVSRIPVNRVVTAAPDIREEGDILIVPVVEEEIVVNKRLVLKEEIHIHRRQERTRVAKNVDLAREHAIVDRLDSEGNVTATSESPRTGTNTGTGLFGKHKSILR